MNNNGVSLSSANKLFKEKKYSDGLEMYLRVQKVHPELSKIVDFNVKLCKKELGINNEEFDIYRKNNSSKIVDIIIPIYNAIDDVKKCIGSLYEHKTYDFNVIAIDDCSDDETKVYLENESKKRGFTLLRNRENLRFTKTVNRGFKESHGDYVVLLNSDTIVTPRWIEKILACFASDEKIGIVGPLSNAASWQTVPVRDDKEFGGWLVNEIPKGYSVEDMGMLVETVSQKLYPKVPSVNGFCYVIKRGVLDKIGALDEEYFPTGYGEEDDFSIRAIDAGFKIAVADDTYIFHAKSKSYTHEVRAVLSVKGRKALDAKHGKERLINIENSWKAELYLSVIANDIKKKIVDYKNIETNKVTLIMLVKNQSKLTKNAISSLFKITKNVDFNLLIVDNNSDEKTKKLLLDMKDKYIDIDIITNKNNKSFSEANNIAVDKAETNLICLINNDLEFIDNNWLSTLVKSMNSNSNIAAVGPMLIYPDYSVQSASLKINIRNKNFIDARENRTFIPTGQVQGITGACMLIRKNIYKEVRGLDERFWYGQEDVDFNLKLLKHGYHIILNSEVKVIHHESVTRKGNIETHNNRTKIRDKWNGKIHFNIEIIS